MFRRPTLTAFDYLHSGITSALSDEELVRFEGLARAHYGGARRRFLTAAIAQRRRTLDEAAVRRARVVGGPLRRAKP